MEITFTLQDLPEIAGKLLAAADTKTLLFYGDMGVGKTTLINVMARQLGVQEPLKSPTFSIVNEYLLENDTLYHFDCYRIENDDEALDIGIDEYFESGHWCFIEWPNKIERLLPEGNTMIKLTKNQNGSRTVYIGSQ
tara:strand:- start:25860 stop:26270 length:411 start_codon:yes stop_codon:yes gene_type:complete